MASRSGRARAKFQKLCEVQ